MRVAPMSFATEYYSLDEDGGYQPTDTSDNGEQDYGLILTETEYRKIIFYWKWDGTWFCGERTYSPAILTISQDNIVIANEDAEGTDDAYYSDCLYIDEDRWQVDSIEEIDLAHPDNLLELLPELKLTMVAVGPRAMWNLFNGIIDQIDKDEHICQVNLDFYFG